MHGDRVYQRLTEMSQIESMIKLNANTFKELTDSQETRNFSIVVLFTALDPTSSCPVCRYVLGEFQKVADIYRASQIHSNALFFASIDFDDGPKIFHSFRIKSVPLLMHFPAYSAPEKNDIFLISETHSTTSTAISKWIEYRTGIQLIEKPSDFVENVSLLILIILLAVYVYQQFYQIACENKREAVAVILVAFCTSISGGSVWNYVKGAPILVTNDQYGIMFMHPSHQSQIYMETYMVMFICEYLY